MFDVDKTIKNEKENNELEVVCSMISGTETKSTDIKTRKLSYSLDVGLKTSDNDVMVVRVKDPLLSVFGASISLVFQSDFTDKRMVLIEEEDEGI